MNNATQQNGSGNEQEAPSGPRRSHPWAALEQLLTRFFWCLTLQRSGRRLLDVSVPVEELFEPMIASAYRLFKRCGAKHSTDDSSEAVQRRFAEPIDGAIEHRNLQRRLRGDGILLDACGSVVKEEREYRDAPRQIGIKESMKNLPQSQFRFCGSPLRSVPENPLARGGRGHDCIIGLPGCRSLGIHGQPARWWYGFGPHEAGRATIHHERRGPAKAGHTCQRQQLYQITFSATRKNESALFDRELRSLPSMLESEGAPEHRTVGIFQREEDHDDREHFRTHHELDRLVADGRASMALIEGHGMHFDQLTRCGWADGPRRVSFDNPALRMARPGRGRWFKRTWLALKVNLFSGRCDTGIRHFSKRVSAMSEKFKTWLLVNMGVAGGIAAAILLRCLLDGQPPSPVVILSPEHAGQFEEVKTGPSVAEVVTRQLNWADEQAAAGLAPQLDPIHEFFAEAKTGTRAFAEEALGWDSKWKFVKGYIAGGDGHRRYLEQRFAARVFAQENLEKTVQYAVKAHLDHVDNVDAMLLVNLKADLEGIPASNFSADVDRAAIEQSLHAAIHDAMRAAEADFPGMIGRELISMVAGEVAAQAGVKLATSAGILTAGVSSGTVTFGAGLVIGLIVDAIVAWAYDELVDPAGELSRQLDGTLTQLEHIIVAGQGDEPGLQQRLLNFAARRGEARKAAINSVVLP